MDVTAREDPGFLVPAGTVTLLLADVEGSTRRWEEGAAEMPALLADVRGVVDEVVGRHHGVRPEEQGEGDSFVAAFARASDAVAGALALQRATAGRSLRLRVGVHTGEVQLRGARNYIGVTVNRCARLRDAGHGGQVLVSQATAHLVQDRLPEGAGLIDLGVHQLRDLGRPDLIYQLCHPDLQNVFPPLRTLDQRRHNLGVELTSFVGRAQEMDEVGALVDEARIVTLTGAGGCGKTRLALQLAAQRLDRHPDGVWLVDFSPLRDAELVADAVAEVLSLPPATAATPVESLVLGIGGRDVLLVLDNCEHVIAACAALAEGVLRRCPRVAMVATSREPLGVAGETVYRVPSLSFPAEGPNAPIEGLGRFDAVELFAERARRARPGFVLDDATAPVVAEICRRLDGIPLAIELAAARVRVLRPAQIRDGLRDRFHLLTGGARTAVPRQQTLQASVDWSHALLLEPERMVLRRLSVFNGGFTLEAAEAVAVGAGIEAHHVLDLLSHLVDKSLVLVDDDRPEGRFRLLETVRHYAIGRLVEAGEAAPIRRAHLDYFFAYARRRSDESEDGYRERIRVDYDNIRGALLAARDLDDRVPLLGLACRLYPFWFASRYLHEAKEWLVDALGRASDAEPADRARALRALAHANLFLDDWEGAAKAAEDSVDLFRRLGDTHGLLRSLITVGEISAMTSRGTTPQEEAVALAREIGDHRLEAEALITLGFGLLKSDPAAARPVLEEARLLAQEAGAQHDERQVLSLLGPEALASGQLELAKAYIEEALTGLRSTAEGILLSLCLTTWVGACASLGDLDAARAGRDELASVTQQMGVTFVSGAERTAAAICAWYAGDSATAAEAFDQAAQSRPSHSPLGYAAAVALQRGEITVARARAEQLLTRLSADGPQDMGFLPFQCNRDFALTILGFVERAEGNITCASARFHDALAAAETAGVPNQINAVVGAAVDATDHGSWAEAARLLGAADHAANELGCRLYPMLEQIAESARVAARARLEDEPFDEYRAEGEAMSIDDAIAYAQRARGKRQRPANGWASLTPTEAAVVARVAEGLTNHAIGARLFMSPRTVATHLTHVYAKLGYSSRSELAAHAAHRGMT